jgi:hypothetical protein
MGIKVGNRKETLKSAPDLLKIMVESRGIEPLTS